MKEGEISAINLTMFLFHYIYIAGNDDDYDRYIGLDSN